MTSWTKKIKKSSVAKFLPNPNLMWRSKAIAYHLWTSVPSSVKWALPLRAL